MLEKVIVPNVKYAQTVYEEYLVKIIEKDSVWLDLGCGRRLLPEWRSSQEKILINQCKVLVGCDGDINSLNDNVSIKMKIMGDIESIPVRNEVFDIVSANMVLEHLKCPEKAIREIKRILKPGGIFIFHTPNRKGYVNILGDMIPNVFRKTLIVFLEGRREEDVFKTYYEVNTIQKIENIAFSTGMNIVELKMITSTAALAMLLPLSIIELIWIRVLSFEILKKYRTNIIGIMEKRLQ